MTEQVPVSEDISCPGCHFECKLVKYQCGRGKEFFDLAASGGEVPIRRGPMLSPSEVAAGKPPVPPVNDRIMHGFTIVANKMQDRHAESKSEKIVTALVRQGSFMSLPLLAKRSLLSRDELDAGLEEAREAGYASVEVDERVGRVARLTDAGKKQADAFKEARDAGTAELLSGLSEDEKETLAALIRKVLGMR